MEKRGGGPGAERGCGVGGVLPDADSCICPGRYVGLRGCAHGPPAARHSEHPDSGLKWLNTFQRRWLRKRCKFQPAVRQVLWRCSWSILWSKRKIVSSSLFTVMTYWSRWSWDANIILKTRWFQLCGRCTAAGSGCNTRWRWCSSGRSPLRSRVVTQGRLSSVRWHPGS